MTRYATNIENDGGCPDCDSYERKIDGMNAKMADLEAHLSSKEQELKELSDKYAQLWGDWNREQFSQRLDEIASLRAEMDSLKKEHQEKIDMLNIDLFVAHDEADKLRAENERLTIMATDAELLRTKLDYKTEENKQNILIINDLRKRCEDLEAALKEVLPWALESGHVIPEELEIKCNKLLSQ